MNGPKPVSLDNDVRREILRLVRDGEKTPAEIAATLGRRLPGVSYHLSRLLEERLVHFRRERAFRHYRLCVAATLDAWDDFIAEELTPEMRAE